jgi:hypothetical protein
VSSQIVRLSVTEGRHMTRMRSARLLLLVPLPLLLAPVNSPHDPGSIAGVLLDPKGEPVRDTEVVLKWGSRSAQPVYEMDWGARLKTGPNGEFLVEGVRAGFVILRITAPDILPLSSEHLRLMPGHALEGIELRSPGYGGRILGSVIDEKGDPVAGAAVVVGKPILAFDVVRTLDWARRGGASAISDADGTFRTRPVPPGKHQINVYAAGFPRWRRDDVIVRELGEVPLEVILPRCLPGTWTLTGTVTNEDGQPLRKAIVQAVVPATPPQREPAYRIVTSGTEEDGQFLLVGLPPDTTIPIEAYHLDHGTWWGEMKQEAGDHVTRAVTLLPGPGLRGTVIEPDGSPRKRDDLRMIPRRVAEGGWEHAVYVDQTTDEVGAYSFRGLLPGEYVLSSGVPATWDGRSKTLRIGPERDIAVHDLVYRMGATVRGVVVDPAGRPIERAEVSLYGGRGDGERDTTDAAGAFEVGQRSAADCYLHAFADGYWPVSLECAFDCGDVFEGVEVRLGAGPAISGVVRDVGGEALAGARIRVTGNHSAWVGTTPTWLYRDVRSDYATTTLDDGTFTIRGVTASSAGLIVAKDWDARCVDTRVRPGPPAAGPVRPLIHLRRLANHAFVPAGGVVVDVPRGGDVEGVEIRLTEGLPADELCTVSGRIEDPAGFFAGEDELKLLLSETLLGPHDLVLSKHPEVPNLDAIPVRLDGRFSAPGVIPSTYTIIAGANTEYLQLGELSLQPGERRDLGAIRIPIPGSVEGTALGEDGKPADGEAYVVAGRDSSDTWRAHINDGRWGLAKGAIDPAGHYRIDGLMPGYWFLRVVYPANHSRPPMCGIKRVFVDGGTRRLDLDHDYRGGFAGRVVRPSGTPVPEATLHLYSDWCVGKPKAKTDEDGRYKVSGLPAGTYSFEITCPRYWPTRVPAFAVPEEGLVTMDDVVLWPAAILKGRIVRPEGRAGRWTGPGPTIELWTATRRVRQEWWAHLTNEGEFESRPLEPGTYVVKARDPDSPTGFWAESEPVELAEGQVAENVVVELPLEDNR